MEYTKGNWEANKVTDFDQNELFAIHTYHSGRIQRVADVWIEANAHLISAAPKMCEALKAIRDGLRLNQGDTLIESLKYVIKASLQIADEALAKAEGK